MTLIGAGVGFSGAGFLGGLGSTTVARRVGDGDRVGIGAGLEFDIEFGAGVGVDLDNRRLAELQQRLLGGLR